MSNRSAKLAAVSAVALAAAGAGGYGAAGAQSTGADDPPRAGAPMHHDGAQDTMGMMGMMGMTNSMNEAMMGDPKMRRMHAQMRRSHRLMMARMQRRHMEER